MMRRALTVALCALTSSCGTGPEPLPEAPDLTSELRLRMETVLGGASAVPTPAALEDGEQLAVREISAATLSVHDVASGVGVVAHLVGAEPGRLQLEAQPWSAARRVLPDADLLRVRGSNAVEDFLVLERGSKTRHVAYALELSAAVAAVRLVGSVVELLDAEGTPRLRARRPWVAFRRDGGPVREAARVEVTGCSVDRDPRAPWGRSTLSPASPHCTLQLGFDADGADGDIVVDPLWESTQDMAEPRYGHTATRLSSERTLIVGGATLAGAAAELFDPLTRTFATTGTPAVDRRHHAAATFPSDTEVFVAGGEGLGGALVLGTERYTVSTGLFTSGGSLSQGRKETAVVTSFSVAYVVAGLGASGYLTSVEKYTAGSGMSSVGSILHARGGHAVHLSGADITVLGGRDGSGALTSTERYSTTSNTSTDRGPLAQARAFFAMGPGPSPNLVLLGGEAGTDKLDTIETYNPSTGTATLLTSITLSQGRSRAGLHARTTVAEPWFYLIGGEGDAGLVADVDVVVWKNPEPVTGVAGRLATPRAGAAGFFYGQRHAQGDLPIVSGGRTSTGEVLASVERLRIGAVGSCTPSELPCEHGAECASGVCINGRCCAEHTKGGACESDFECDVVWGAQCVDGYCCTTCAAQCMACDVEGLEGLCVPVRGQPHGDRDSCVPDGQSPTACGLTCDGASSSCNPTPYGTACGAPACNGDAVSDTVCDGAGACGMALSSMSCAPYSCDAGACRDRCASDAECAAGYACINQRCTTTLQPVCDGNARLVFPNGDTAVDCRPYLCEPGATACNTTCKGYYSCAEGNECTEEGECKKWIGEKTVLACSAASSPSFLVVLSLALAALWERRRRRPRPA